MRVCTECGWRYEDDRETCLVCGGEVVPLEELFLPPPQPFGSYLAWFSRRFEPFRRRFRAWIAEADVADREGGSFLLWWQDLSFRRPSVSTLVVAVVVLVFALLLLGPTLSNISRAVLTSR